MSGPGCDTTAGTRPGRPGCGASAMAAAGGPAAVPFRLCCAMSIIGRDGAGPTAERCGAFHADAAAALQPPVDVRQDGGEAGRLA
jgi:hypothetical protein